MSKAAAELVARGLDTVLEPGDPGYQEEVAGFNTAVVHRPAVVVGARSTEDVVRALDFARARGWPVAVQSTGHGARAPVEGGLLLTMRRLDDVRLDVSHRRATVGAGARWGALVATAAPHGLAPIAGSSLTVGVVGFLLGGGIGPLARSHGFGSDYLVAATLVTGAGEVLNVRADQNADVLWALRGGQPQLGVVTEVELRLAELPVLYAGSLFFDEQHIEAGFRGWTAWTQTADPRVTTSIAVVRFPPADAIPPALRGRRVLTLRFAYPGNAVDGARLAAPLRAMAPVYLDQLGALPIADVAQIFNDPPHPVPSWVSAGSLTHVDQDFASALLHHVGAGTSSPFLAAEVRHLGEATTRDVPAGSAVGGRTAQFTFALIAASAKDFPTLIPEAEARIVSDLALWLSADVNGNFVPNPLVRRPLAASQSQAVRARLAELAQRHDPDGLFRTSALPGADDRV